MIVKGRYFKRAPEDKEDLQAHGFAEGTNTAEVRVYRAARQAVRLYPESFNVEKVAYWRINPDPEEKGTFQLCDAESVVSYKGSVEKKDGTKRKLDNGYLRLKNKKLKRDPEDKEDLQAHGFILKDGDDIKVYGANAFSMHAIPARPRNSKYQDVDFNQVCCWRVHPEKDSFLQLLGAYGNALHEEPVIENGELRRLLFGCLILEDNRSYYCLRAPDDFKNLEENGFAPEQHPRYLDVAQNPSMGQDSGMEDLFGGEGFAGNMDFDDEALDDFLAAVGGDEQLKAEQPVLEQPLPEFSEQDLTMLQGPLGEADLPAFSTDRNPMDLGPLDFNNFGSFDFGNLYGEFS